MQIEVTQVTKTTKQGKTAYIMLEVAYKQLNGTYAGKLASKKIMSFVQPDNVYKALADAKSGDVFNIKSHKNMETGFIDWDDAEAVAPGNAIPVPQQEQKSMPANKSTYETPEERAKKQVYIVKQSSLSAAIDVLKHNNPKAAVEPTQAVQMAQEFVDWVFASPSAPANVVPEDDVPY